MTSELLAAHRPWPVLAIAVPLAAALLAPLLGRRAALLHLIVAPVGLALALLSAGQVLTQGAFTYAIGGWTAPLGVQLRVDGLAAAFLMLTAVTAAVVGLYATRYFDARAGETRQGYAFHPLFFVLWAGLGGIFLSGDLFNLYVGLELVTLAAVALVALTGEAATLAAALRYLLFALFGSLAYLAGTALIYGGYGVLDLRLLEPAIRPDAATLAAAALITAGLLAKTALFPLHAWLPPAHAGAPAPASALLSALVVKAAFYVLFRLWFDLLAPLATPVFMTVLGGLGAAAVVYGSLAAFRQQRLKLIVAYSTVAQLGLLFLVFPLADGVSAERAWSGAVFQALAHALAKAAMFLAAGALMLAAGGDDLASLRGLSRRAPVAVFGFGMAAVSLMGLPPSGGFMAKYLLLTAAADAGAWWWAATPLAAGLLSAAYLFRPLSRMFESPVADGPAPRRPPLVLQVAPLVLAACAVLLGLLSFEPYRLIQIGAGWTSPEAGP